MHYFKRAATNKLFSRMSFNKHVGMTPHVFSTLNKMQNTLPKNGVNVQSSKTKLMSKQHAIEQLGKIQEERLLAQRIKQKQSENENKIISNGTNNSFIYKNERLPLPRERKYDDSPVDDPSKKETKIVTDQAELANILNILNKNQNPNQANIDEQLKNINTTQKEETSNNLQNLVENHPINPVVPTTTNVPNTSNVEEKPEVIEDKITHVISLIELQNKIENMVFELQKNIYTNPSYNYAKLIEFVYGSYDQYADNPMVFSLICRGLAKANLKQMVKLPEDKIGDIVKYIIDEIKLPKAI